MAFRPRMTSKHSGIAVVGEPRAHASETGLVEVWRARLSAGASGDYVSLDPRLFVVLDPLEAEIELDPGGEGSTRSSAPSASFMPAGAPLRISAEAATTIRHLDLHFDASQLARVKEGRVAEPRLLFDDPRVLRLSTLLEQICETDPDACSGLYGDGLIAALIDAAFMPPNRFRRTALSDRQLRRAIDFIEERFAETIRLQSLADLVGLSETYFSHAFKAATGAPPHRWQLLARVRRAQEMLTRGGMSLTEIALAVGFSDQPHFTRVFREATGLTPTAWRAARRG